MAQDLQKGQEQKGSQIQQAQGNQNGQQNEQEQSQKRQQLEGSDTNKQNSGKSQSSGAGQTEEQQDGQGSNGQSGKHEGVRADKGTGYFPLSDMQFDVVTLVYEKSKALQAYDKYLLDCQPCEELRSLVECIRNDDKKHVEKLKEFLGKC